MVGRLADVACSSELESARPFLLECVAMEQEHKKRKFQTVGDHRIDDQHSFAELAAIYVEFGIRGQAKL